ncbi:LUD domain-containing protein [Hymenobacter humi]|uniref:LUD domain-containing protein n=1 Tax=Hymenobacter humi TaxID=1411620 RepID=A0ABW2U0L7_9BACT
MKAEQFQKDAEAKAFDREHRRKIRFNIGKYDAAVSAGMKLYHNHEPARDRGAYLKATVLEKLDEYLLQFEAAFKARGGRVIWARDAAEALAEIGKLTAARNTKTVVKAKSMTTEEIHLNKYLATQGVESVETDLGEYIVQLNGERPYHIVTPAMHLSKADINNIFVKHLGTESTDDAQQARAHGPPPAAQQVHHGRSGRDRRQLPHRQRRRRGRDRERRQRPPVGHVSEAAHCYSRH